MQIQRNEQHISVSEIASAASGLIAEVCAEVIGKELITRQLLACFVAQGHVLLEDRPGVGKSTLAKAFARAIGLTFKRIQMTSDLLPVDVVGGNMPGERMGSFVFRHGPIFAPVVFVDELNRASARTQSALLEAMEERSVTCDGNSYTLPDPFFVIATQNPVQHPGTFPLPDSQLDRFLMKLSLGMPSREDERALLSGHESTALQHKQVAQRRSSQAAEIAVATLSTARDFLDSVQVSRAVVEYILDLLASSRKLCAPGLSPRAGIGLMKCAKAWALLDGRHFVSPDDVKAVFPAIAVHRLTSHSAHSAHSMQEAARGSASGGGSGEHTDPGSWLLSQVPVRI
jgi:MoxR-like ATPase